MIFCRRRFILSGAAALAAPAVLRAAERAERRFVVLRGGDEIGWQTTEASRVADELRVRVASRIAVSILGIVVYRYELDAEEVWRGGALMRMRSRTDDDGRVVTAQVRRTAAGLIAQGSDWSGEAPGDAGTTSYWTRTHLDRPVWLSTQTGQPLRVTCAQAGRERVDMPLGARDCDRWTVGGDIALDLFYDDRGEWMGSAFDARGETARFAAVAETGRLGPLWAG